MGEIEESIIVRAPLREVYNQWTQLKTFPASWRACRRPGEGAAHRVEALRGARNGGAVLFGAVPNGTRVKLKLTYDPVGAGEKVGDALGFVGRRVEGDLDRFRRFIEERQRATGGWRGEIHGNQMSRYRPGSFASSRIARE